MSLAAQLETPHSPSAATYHVTSGVQTTYVSQGCWQKPPHLSLLLQTIPYSSSSVKDIFTIANSCHPIPNLDLHWLQDVVLAKGRYSGPSLLQHSTSRSTHQDLGHPLSTILMLQPFQTWFCSLSIPYTCVLLYLVCAAPIVWNSLSLPPSSFL